MSEIRSSVCALDCPDCCALRVHVDAEGRGIKLQGDPNHPITRGFLCPKVTRYLDRVDHPARLLYPQRRLGRKGEGRFERISWDDALGVIAERLEAVRTLHGPEAILPYSYGGTLGCLNGAGMDRRFFHRLGASRLDRTICAEAGTAGLLSALGARYATEPEQFSRSRLILAWGANVLGTNPHLWPFIAEARRQGARFYTIDPRRNRTGEAADRHYFIHPGSDAALALAMMHVILGEELHDADYVARYTEGVEALRARVREWTPQRAAQLTGIPAEDIAALAREYATTQPAVIRLNYGVQRSERGAMSVRAIALLTVLTGAWRHSGGGLQLSTSQAFALNRAALERPDLQQRALGREARLVNMTELGHALTEVTDPPVQAMVVYNSNPAAIAPDQNRVLAGLARRDLFLVVLEQFHTDTASFADILLPATTFLEHTDLYTSYGHYYLQLARPALQPPGEAKSNVEVFRLLAQRMGFTDPCFEDTEDEMIRELLDSPSPFLTGITLERLERERSVRLNLPEPFLPFAGGDFGAPGARCDFDAGTLDYTPPIESRRGGSDLLATYPLELLSPKGDSGMNSTFGNTASSLSETSIIHMNPADAGARDIEDGEPVRVFNARGECSLRARITENVPPGVVSAPSTLWPACAPGRRSVNALTSQRLTDHGGSPTFYSCLVNVEKLTPGA
jgi:anaerobic selenocysteine-containing dehydrogenase